MVRRAGVLLKDNVGRGSQVNNSKRTGQGREPFIKRYKRSSAERKWILQVGYIWKMFSFLSKVEALYQFLYFY